MSPELSVLVGVAIGSFGTLIATWIRTKSEERKHIRSLVYSAGVENFKEACEMARNSGEASRIAPLEDYLINMAKISQILTNNPDFNVEELEKMLSEANKTAKVLHEFRNQV